MSRRERRKIVKKLRALEWEIWEMEVMGNAGQPAVYPSGRLRRANTQKLLEKYDSRVLEASAEKWGIEIPVKPDWFATEIIMFDFATVPEGADAITDRWLNEKG